MLVADLRSVLLYPQYLVLTILEVTLFIESTLNTLWETETNKPNHQLSLLFQAQTWENTIYKDSLCTIKYR